MTACSPEHPTSAHAYAENNPVNFADPTGLSNCGDPKNAWDYVGSAIDCVSKADDAVEEALDTGAVLLEGAAADVTNWLVAPAAERADENIIEPVVRELEENWRGYVLTCALAGGTAPLTPWGPVGSCLAAVGAELALNMWLGDDTAGAAPSRISRRSNGRTQK